MKYVNNVYKKIKKCRISDDTNLFSVAKFPLMGLTGTFPKNNYQKIKKTPFEVVFSKKSNLLQLRHNYNPDLLYGKNYGYRSGLNEKMVSHLKKKFKYLKYKYNIKKNDKILDIGSNDGTFLNFFDNSSRCFGIDPSGIKLKKYYKKKIKLFSNTFDKAFTKVSGNKFKLITSIAMFYDLEDPKKIVDLVRTIVNKNGIFHIEVAYLPQIIRTFSYDTFCQEHYEYYSLMSLQYIFKNSNMKIIDFGLNDINGGSIWINVAHSNSKFFSKLNKINTQLGYEKKLGIHKVRTYKNFFKNVFNHAKKLNLLISKLKNKNLKISGLGASTKGNVLLQLAKLNYSKIDRIYDVNKEKFGKFTPITKIKILDETIINKFKQDYILILIWHFKSYIYQKIKKKNNKLKIIVPFPKIKII